MNNDNNIVNSILKILYLCIVIIIFSISITTYKIVYDVRSTVNEIKTEFLQQSKELAKESVIYLKDEYSDDARKITKEVIDSTKSQIINILK